MRGECLEVGVGRPFLIYATMKDAGRTYVCRGAVYSYYEFCQPLDNRLDDGDWRRMSRQFDELQNPPWIALRPELGIVH